MKQTNPPTLSLRRTLSCMIMLHLWWKQNGGTKRKYDNLIACTWQFTRTLPNLMQFSI